MEFIRSFSLFEVRIFYKIARFYLPQLVVPLRPFLDQENIMMMMARQNIEFKTNLIVNKLKIRKQVNARSHFAKGIRTIIIKIWQSCQWLRISAKRSQRRIRTERANFFIFGAHFKTNTVYIHPISFCRFSLYENDEYKCFMFFGLILKKEMFRK